MMHWDFSCPDWWERLQAGESIIPELPLDWDEARRAIGIFNKLRLPDVTGRPMLADAAGDWQRDMVAALFGSIDLESERRLVQEILCLVPKKNSKTTGAGAIMVTALIMDPEPRQAYSLFGPTQTIAQRGFDQASGMIAADPVLKTRFLVKPHLKTIVDQVTESTLKVQTFDESVATGEIPKGMLIDELHILGKVHYAQRVLGQLRGGLVSKPRGFLMMITTQSDQPPAGVFKAELDMARAIRDGRVTGEAATMLPVLYEFPESVQTDKAQPWRNVDMWPLVLPNLGRSCQLDLLRSQWAAAQEKGAEETQRWASQHLNIEIGLGLHSARWRGADFWESAADRTLTLESLLERSEVVTIGVDGGGMDDLYGLCVLGRERGTKHWLAWHRAWVQADVLDLRKDIAPRLQDFAADGDLILCDSVSQDIEEIAAIIGQVQDSGLLPDDGAVGLDPQGIAALVDALAGIGLDDSQLRPVAQGFRLNGAVLGSERKLKDGTLFHDGSALMEWCVGNAKSEQRGNAVCIEKSVSGKAKIDPLIALFNAVQLMARNPDAAGRTVYEERGLLRV